MNPILHECIGHVPPVGFTVHLGTSACKVAIAVDKLEHVHNLASAEDRVPGLAIDADGTTTSFRVPMVETCLDDMNLSVDEFVPATFPDRESLQKAERKGRLWPMDPSWYKQPGVTRDDRGSGGNPRNGHGLAILNSNTLRKKVRRNIRNCGDYQHQRVQMDQSVEKGAKSLTITVVVCVSLLGGFGTGTLRTLLRIIREETLDLKVPIKIILLGIAKGSLEPADGAVAARNQSMTMRELNAALVGRYKDVDQDPRISQLICDSVILVSNANNHGEFNDLDRLIALCAQYIFYLFHTPLGQAIQEKAVDIEEYWPKDDLGGRCCVSTMGISKIHLDLPRAICAQGNMLLRAFLEQLMSSQKEPIAAKEANLLAAEKQLAETETVKLASERLQRLNTFRGAHARGHAVASFQQRCGRRWGFNHCCDLDKASSYILDIELPRRLKPQIRREAQTFISQASKAVENKVRGLLARPDGIRMATQMLEALTAELTRYSDANRRKLDVAQSKKRSIDDSLGHAHDMLNRLRKRCRLFRALSLSTKGEICRIIGPSTESAIRNRLEITARLSLANEVYPAVQECLSEQQARVGQLINNVTAVMTDVSCEADRLRVAEPILIVPMGRELVNEDFIDRQYTRIVQAEDGLERILEKVFAEFQGRYKNLLAFNHIDVDQIKKTLLEYCLGIGRRYLGTLKAADVFRESFKSPCEPKDRIGQNLRESRGRLRLAGEADEIIPTMKFIGVGDRATGEWMAAEANEIDGTSGDWQPIEIDDPLTIVFYQQRARISLTRLIADTDALWEPSCNPQEWAKLGSDPILALAPQPDCHTQEVRSCFAMGIASGALHKLDGGYELNGEPDDPIFLGKNLDEIIEHFREDYEQLIRLYSSSVNRLGNGCHNSRSAIDWRARFDEQDAGDVLAQIGQDALVRMQETITALMPYLVRRPRALCTPPGEPAPDGTPLGEPS
jgi:tubulin-like protein